MRVVTLLAIVGLVILVVMITAGLRGANALLKRTQAAQDEAMENHRSGLAQIEEGTAMQRETVELSRRTTAAAERTADIAAEIREMLMRARDKA